MISRLTSPSAQVQGSPSAEGLEVDVRPRVLFYYGALLAVVLVRFSFIFTGSRAWADESRYSLSLRALDSLLRKDVTQFFYHLSSADARPGASLLNLLPGAVQGAMFVAFGLNPDTPHSYLVPLLFNCLVLLLSMYLLYRIGLLVLRDQATALAVVVIYSCLINTNIYLRHLIPYDLAIAISLFLMLRVLTIVEKGYHVSRWQAFYLGAGAMFTFGVYPGYYLIIPIIGLLLVDWRNLLARFATHLQLGLSYTAGVLAVFLLFEGIAWLGGMSYLQSSTKLSGTIVQGAFDEGFTFLFRYLVSVEGALGLLVLLCMAASLVLLGQRWHAVGLRRFFLETICRPTSLLAVFFVAGFLLHASLSYFFHKMVFYGRLIHPYYPIILLYCVGSVLLLAQRYFRPAPLVAAGLALGAFGIFAARYVRLVYPRDVLYRYGIDTQAGKVRYFDEAAESMPSQRYKSPMVLRRGGAYTAYPGTLTLVNCSNLYPVSAAGFRAYVPPAGQRLLYEGASFCSFPAYTFEGLDREGRQTLQQQQVRFRIYIK